MQVILGPACNGQPATATVTLIVLHAAAGRSLHADRSPTTSSDPAGNRLDGETNAAEPQETRGSPAATACPAATSWPASRSTAGRSWASTPARVYVDINGNFVFDPEGAGQRRSEPRHRVPLRLDQRRPVRRQVRPASASTADGRFDQLAAYGNIRGAFRWLFDFDYDGVADLVTTQPAVPINGMPVAGNFDGNAGQRR